VETPRGDGKPSLNITNPRIGQTSLNTHPDDGSKPQRGVGGKQLLKMAKTDLKTLDLERFWWQPIQSIIATSISSTETYTSRKPQNSGRQDWVPSITPAPHSTYQQISLQSEISNDSNSRIVNEKAGENSRCHLPPGNASKALAPWRKLTFQSLIHTGSWLSTKCPPSDDGHTSCWRQIVAESTGKLSNQFVAFPVSSTHGSLCLSIVFATTSVFRISIQHSPSSTLHLSMGSHVVACAHCLVPQ
jgi:hypothetical protein